MLIEKEEVKQYDGYSLIDGMIDKSQAPHKLHLIKKIKELKGEPWWVKEAMSKLGFYTRRNNEWHITVSVKPNTQEINNIIWLCKHCVKITPINLENGAPTTADIKYTKINLENGNLNIIKKIDTINIDDELCYKINDVVVSEMKKPSDTFRIEKNDLHRYFHDKKNNCQLNSEYFPTKYTYPLGNGQPGVINIKGEASTSIAEDD